MSKYRIESNEDSQSESFNWTGSLGKVPDQSQDQPLGRPQPKHSCKALEGAPEKSELSQYIQIWNKTLRHQKESFPISL